MSNSTPDYAVPTENSNVRAQWKQLMSDSRFNDLLHCPINEASLRQLSELATVPSSVKKAANVFFYTVTGALTNPYTVIHRFFVGGDYGRKTAVGDFNDLRLLAYVNEEPPYDVPDKGKNSLSAQIAELLRSHFQSVRKGASGESAEETYKVKELRYGDVLVYSNLGREMLVRAVPACANPCNKGSEGENFSQLGIILQQMCSADWHRSSADKDALTYCYLEEVSCRILSSLPDLWIRFIKLCKYLCAVHNFPLESDFVETVALRCLIGDITRDCWPFTKVAPITTFDWALQRFLSVIGDVAELNKLDAVGYPPKITSNLLAQEKICLSGEQIEEINLSMSEIHKAQGEILRPNNKLGLMLRPFFRPFHNLGDAVEANDWAIVRTKASALLETIRDDVNSVRNLFDPIQSDKAVKDGRSSILSKSKSAGYTKKRRSVAGTATRYILKSMVLGFSFILTVLFALTLAYAFLLSDRGEVDPISWDNGMQMFHTKLVEGYSFVLERNAYARIASESPIFHRLEDLVENTMLALRGLPRFLNTNVPVQWRTQLLTARQKSLSATAYVTVSGLDYANQVWARIVPE